MAVNVTVDAIRAQLENLGRKDVPDSLIASFLDELGVEPRTSGDAALGSPRRGRAVNANYDAAETYAGAEEEDYEDDFDDDDDGIAWGGKENDAYAYYEEERSGLGRREATSSRPELRSPRAAPRPQSARSSPRSRPVEERSDYYTHQYAADVRHSTTRRPLSARRSSSSVFPPRAGSAPKTDRVANWQSYQESWKRCSAAQTGKKRSTVNYHLKFAAEHAHSARQTKKAVQKNRRTIRPPQSSESRPWQT